MKRIVNVPLIQAVLLHSNAIFLSLGSRVNPALRSALRNFPAFNTVSHLHHRSPVNNSFAPVERCYRPSTSTQTRLLYEIITDRAANTLNSRENKDWLYWSEDDVAEERKIRYRQKEYGRRRGVRSCSSNRRYHETNQVSS